MSLSLESSVLRYGCMSQTQATSAAQTCNLKVDAVCSKAYIFIQMTPRVLNRFTSARIVGSWNPTGDLCHEPTALNVEDAWLVDIGNFTFTFQLSK